MRAKSKEPMVIVESGTVAYATCETAVIQPVENKDAPQGNVGSNHKVTEVAAMQSIAMAWQSIYVGS